MTNKKNVQSMTPEELAAYVEVVRQRNRVNAKKYYDEKIKTDPENSALSHAYAFVEPIREPTKGKK
jgi:hypothetical protein